MFFFVIKIIQFHLNTTKLSIKFPNYSVNNIRNDHMAEFVISTFFIKKKERIFCQAIKHCQNIWKPLINFFLTGFDAASFSVKNTT